MEKVFDFVANYAFILIWVLIILLNILQKYSKNSYKYEQRIPNKATPSQELNSKGKSLSFGKRTSFLRLFLITFYVITLIASIVTITLYGLKFTSLKSASSPLIYVVLNIAFAELMIHYTTLTKFFRYTVRICYTLFCLTLYCLLAYNRSYFVDLLIVFITLILYALFSKSKFKYPILAALIGINFIVLAQSFNSTNLTIIYDVIFALGTGLIVTGMGNIIIVIERDRKKLQERRFELRDIEFILQELMESIYLTYSKRLLYSNDNFYFIDYELFKKDLLSHLKKGNLNLINDFQERIIHNIIALSDYSNNLYKNEKYLLLNHIFNEDEIDAIYQLYETSTNLIHHYHCNDSARVKILFERLIDDYDNISSVIPEIEDLTNQFGKDKIFAEYEIITFKRVWPNGDKVKPSEIYKPKSNKKSRY